MRLACFASGLTILLALSACEQFEKHEVLPSGSGVYATVGVTPSGGARTICLDVRPVDVCPRSRAIFYGYRGRDGDAGWIDDKIFYIAQEGGEVRTRPPERPIEVGGQQITVKLEYRP